MIEIIEITTPSPCMSGLPFANVGHHTSKHTGFIYTNLLLICLNALILDGAVTVNPLNKVAGAWPFHPLIKRLGTWVGPRSPPPPLQAVHKLVGGDIPVPQPSGLYGAGP